MNYPKILARIGLGYFVFVMSLQAETLVQYTFTEKNTSTSRDASTIGANVTPEAFANGGGITIVASAIGSPSASSYYVQGNDATAAISPTSPDWLGFTISANSGYELDLENLSFAYAFSYNSGTAPTTPATFDVRSSVDDYGTSIAVLTASVATANVVNWSNASIVLSDAAFQNLGSIEFRIFLNDGANENSASYLRLDTVTLTGVSATAIPEPATYALLIGAGGLLIAGLRRRRSRR